MISCKSDAGHLKFLKTEKSPSTIKDFVALAGTRQKEAKQLLKVTDINFDFLDHTNSVIRASRNSNTPADAHRLRVEHEQSQRERALERSNKHELTRNK